MEANEIENKAQILPQEAKALVIEDDASFQRAGAFLVNIKKVRAEINETFDPIIKKQHEAHKEAVAQKKKIEAPLIEAESIIKPRMAAYHEEQERKRREEEDRIRKEADRKAQEEQIADAVLAHESGQEELGDAILEAPAYIPTIVAPKAAVKIEGVSFRDNYKAEVTDLKALMMAVLEGQVPSNVIEANMSVLNSLARSLKGQLNYPGVRVVCEKITAGSRRANAA